MPRRPRICPAGMCFHVLNGAVARLTHLLTVLRYVERNPLRASLCERAEDWRFGSLWRRKHGTPPQQQVLSEWPIAGPRQWAAHVNRPQSEADLTTVRNSVRKGTPYGSGRFVIQSAVRLQLEHTLRPRGRPRNNELRPLLFLGYYQPLGSTEPNGGWEWISGEITTGFEGWLSPEPNDASPGEDYGTLQFHLPFPRWNDWGPDRPDFDPIRGLIELDSNPFPEPIVVAIDIKPGSDPNSINLRSNGVLPVAILTTNDFDVFDVDDDTLRFGDPELVNVAENGVTPLKIRLEDVDDDGDLDLLLFFSVPEIDVFGALDENSVGALVTGTTVDDVPIVGADLVRIVPPKGRGKSGK